MGCQSIGTKSVLLDRNLRLCCDTSVEMGVKDKSSRITTFHKNSRMRKGHVLLSHSLQPLALVLAKDPRANGFLLLPNLIQKRGRGRCRRAQEWGSACRHRVERHLTPVKVAQRHSPDRSQHRAQGMGILPHSLWPQPVVLRKAPRGHETFLSHSETRDA